MNDDKKLSPSIYNQDGEAPNIVVPRDPEPHEVDAITDYLSTEEGFLEYALDQDTMDENSHTGVWEWEEYQRQYFRTESWFITNKCRQSGVSYALAAKAFAKGILSPTSYNMIFTSYKKEEAINKINYVRTMLSALPPTFKKKIIRDPFHLIEFENKNGTRIKILSHAQKPIRGINGDIGLDELAFYLAAEEIYASALPAVARVKGNIDIISTPFGKSGKFYDIFTDLQQYPEYYRLPIMWWHSRQYLRDQTDEGFIEAMIGAPKMGTEERVYTFGSASIKKQFKNSDLETFRQEFEGFFVDEQAAFFSRDLIMRIMFGIDNGTPDEYAPEDNDFDISIDEALEVNLSPMEKMYGGRADITGRLIHFKKYDSLAKLYAAARSNEITGNLLAGADIGTSRHSTHISVLEEIVLPDSRTIHIERFNLNRREWDLDEQEIYFAGMLRSGVIRKLGMDTTGIGYQMGQTLSKLFPSRFRAFHMGGNNKHQEQMMVNLKNRMGAMTIALIFDKPALEDLYSIERIVNANKSISFRAPEKKKHHADAAWAIAIASLIGTKGNEQPLSMELQSTASHSEKRIVQHTDGIPRINSANLNNRLIRGGISSMREVRELTGLMSPGKFYKDYDS